MPTRRAPSSPPTARRAPLSVDAILDAAVELADRDGLEAVTMRRLGKRLGVEAMSLYKHVADKDAVLAGIADRVAEAFVVPSREADWRASLRASYLEAHRVLLRHPWAAGLLESTLQPGPARLAYLDAVVGVLRKAGFDLPDVAHAFGALDSHLYGFTLQATSLPFDVADAPETAAALAEALPPDRYPNLIAMATMVAEADDGYPLDFTFGLDLLLDGLAGRLAAAEAEGPRGRLRP
jgi:AcrR family transcriptional regulator